MPPAGMFNEYVYSWYPVTKIINVMFLYALSKTTFINEKNMHVKYLPIIYTQYRQRIEHRYMTL